MYYVSDAFAVSHLLCPTQQWPRCGAALLTPRPAPALAAPGVQEGSGAPAELAISLLLGAFIITLPLTISSIGRRLWIKYKFTNKVRGLEKQETKEPETGGD